MIAAAANSTGKLIAIEANIVFIYVSKTVSWLKATYNINKTDNVWIAVTTTQRATSMPYLSFGFLIKRVKSKAKPVIKPKKIRGKTETNGFWNATLPTINALAQQKTPKARPESKPAFQPKSHAKIITKM